VAENVTRDEPDPTPRERVSPENWPDLKPFEKPASATWNVELHAEEVNRLVLGFQPQDMEDRWMVYSLDPVPGKLRICFHRSWTSARIVELDLDVETRDAVEGSGLEYGAGRVTGLTWENCEPGRESEESMKKTVVGLCRSFFDVDLGNVEDSVR